MQHFEPDFLGGAQWRRTHQATIDSILGAGVRSVVVDARAFRNIDAFALPLLVEAIAQTRARRLTRAVVAGWVERVNTAPATRACIQMGATPDDLPPDFAHALVGGGYIEAFRTLYARRGGVTVEEVYALVAPRWGLVPDWSRCADALRGATDALELHRLHALGTAEFPGTLARVLAFDAVLRRFDDDNPLADASAPRLLRAQARVRALRDLSGQGGGEQADLAPIIGAARALSASEDLTALALGMQAAALLDVPPRLWRAPQSDGARSPEQPPAPPGTCVDAALTWSLDCVFASTPDGERRFRASGRKADGLQLSDTQVTPVKAQALKVEARAALGSLAARLRRRFLALRAPVTVHGVRRGLALSERRLVDSYLEARAGQPPSRPDFSVVRGPSCGLSVAIVVDRSGSMERLAESVNVAAGGVADALHQVGCPVMMVGFTSYVGVVLPGEPKFMDRPVFAFRDARVCLELYKDWNEPMSAAVWSRLAHLPHGGGTPMGDGIEVALRGLRTCTDRHRVVLVITDGMPDDDEVVRRQQRVAAEEGIIVIGVEVSEAPEGVAALFKHSVIAPFADGLGERLVRRLESIVFSDNPPPRRALGGLSTSMERT